MNTRCMLIIDGSLTRVPFPMLLPKPHEKTKSSQRLQIRRPLFCLEQKKKKDLLYVYDPDHVTEMTTPGPRRITAEFHPSVWGNYFLKLDSNDKMVRSWKAQAEVLKEKVKDMFMESVYNHSYLLQFIDLLQRLGIDHIFELEINGILQQIFTSYDKYDDGNDLYTVALQFRLLRQACYYVSTDVFNKFKNENGEFKESLRSDVQGMLSLYEASFLGFHGEDILDEALSFTKSGLTFVLTRLDPPLADHIRYVLEHPIRRTIPKHGESYYISYYELHGAHNESLLKLAKLNFNIVQNLYQEELKSLTGWWQYLNFSTNLPYSRDRMIECFFVGLAAASKPEHTFARRCIAQFGQLGTTMDDTFDNYGTIEELEIFNETIQRWDTSMKHLPDYMKPFFEAITAVVQGIGDESTFQGRQYHLNYAKKAFQDLAGAYITEARWLKESYVPTLEEYRQVAGITSIYPAIVYAGFCGMGASEELLEWLLSKPKLLVALSDHCRILDDIMSNEFEQQREHVASSIECYMRQYGVSKQEARNGLYKLTESDWKDINEDMIKQVEVPKSIRMLFLNLTRVSDILFRHINGYSDSNGMTKDILTALLVTPMTI